MNNCELITIYSGSMRGDGCSHNTYKPQEPTTVRELCEYIISNKGEWGYIGINDGHDTIFGNPQIEYFHGIYCDGKRNPIPLNFPEEILNSYVESIDWDGGWSRGDWLITLKGCNPEQKPEPSEEVSTSKKIEEIVNQKIKNMTNEELERYILEAKAKKLMLEEFE